MTFQRFLGKNELAVQHHFINTATALDKLRRNAIPIFDESRQPGGSRFVVSHHTIFNGDGTGSNRCLSHVPAPCAYGGCPVLRPNSVTAAVNCRIEDGPPPASTLVYGISYCHRSGIERFRSCAAAACPKRFVDARRAHMVGMKSGCANCVNP